MSWLFNCVRLWDLCKDSQASVEIAEREDMVGSMILVIGALVIFVIGYITGWQHGRTRELEITQERLLAILEELKDS